MLKYLNSISGDCYASLCPPRNKTNLKDNCDFYLTILTNFFRIARDKVTLPVRSHNL